MPDIDKEMPAKIRLAKSTQMRIAIVFKGADASFLLDKKKIPAKEIADLKKSTGGSLVVKGVAESDEGVFKVKVAKEPPSTAAKALKKSIKECAGLTLEVEFVVDTSVGEDEDDEAQAPAPGAPSAEAPPPPPAPPVAFDAVRFSNEMKRLVPEIAKASAADPTKAEAMKQSAADLVGAIKNKDADSATSAIKAIEALLSAAGVSPATPAAPAAQPKEEGSFVKMQKSRLLWDSARKRINSEVKSLKKAVEDEYGDDPEVTKIFDGLGELDEMLVKLDERLIDTLDDLLNATDPEKRAELLEDAKEQISDYIAYTQASKLVQALDGDTPLGMKLSIGSTLNATLKALQANLR